MHKINKIKRMHKRMQMLIASDPRLRNVMKVKDLLRTTLKSFVYLSVAHFNEQLLYIVPSSNSPCSHNEHDFEDMLDLAVDYFLRNRSRLFEWWCRYTLPGAGAFADMMDDVDRISLDYNGFDNVFEQVCKKHEIDLKLDRFCSGKCPAINTNGMPNSMFMKYVMKRAIKIELECPF